MNFENTKNKKNNSYFTIDTPFNRVINMCHFYYESK